MRRESTRAAKYGPFGFVKRSIFNEDNLSARAEKRAHPNRTDTAMPPTNMQEDNGPTLALKDVLCMASLVIDCYVFSNKNQSGAVGSSRPPRPPSLVDDKPLNRD